MAAPAPALKIAPKTLPVEVAAPPKSLAVNAAAAADVIRKFSEAVSMRVPADLVPKYASAVDVKLKRYHVGCVKGSPFNVMYVLNREFPYMSGDLTRNPSAPESTRMNEKLGCEMELSDEEVSVLIKASTLRGWRHHGKSGEENSSQRWQCLRLGEPDVYFRPGDKLDAHFVYIRPLADNEHVYPGVIQNDGSDVPTPTPLLTE